MLILYILKYEMAKTKQNKEAVGRAWRLLQYYLLPDKSSRDIKQIIWRISRNVEICYLFYRGADKSLARPGRKQATATEDFEFHKTYL